MLMMDLWAVRLHASLLRQSLLAYEPMIELRCEMPSLRWLAGSIDLHLNR
jgi:hypothetical protein